VTKGTIGIIGCPILEDEIIHSLITDGDGKNIYVVDVPAACTIRKKLESKGVMHTMMDEWEFEKGFVEMDGDGFNVVIIMNKLGLHSRPEFLRSTIEGQLVMYQDRFDVIALCYGMCGNNGWDVTEWASEKLRIPVSVFRDENGDVCDDCIGVAVGGHRKYCDFVKRYTGMLFVTPAIAGNWKEFSGELNFCKGFDVLGIHTVKGVFELFGYKYAVKIDTGIGIRGKEFDDGCDRLSEETGLTLVDAHDGASDIYPTERMWKDAKSALEKPKRCDKA
jgi:hypothetical protein